jgi:hypothetical protein
MHEEKTQELAEVQSSTGSEEKDDPKKPKPGTIMPGSGNGSKTDKYMWTQHHISEISVNIPVPANIRGRDMIVECEAKTILVQMKGQQTPIIKGAFCKPICVNFF